MWPSLQSFRRGGFTLVEFLVVIAMIGLLVALLLPAVQAARESARRVQCINNLKQIGLALHNFESSHKFWPPGAIDGNVLTEAHATLRLPAGPEHGWLVFLLPPLGQQPLYDRYRFSADWRDPVNRPVCTAYVPSLQCPSTPNPTRMDQGTSGGFTWSSAPTDYGAVNNVDATLFRQGLIDLRTVRFPEGMLRVNQIQPLSEMVDGASNQLVVAEDAGRQFHFGTGRRLRKGGRCTGAGWGDRDNEFTVHGTALDGLASPGPCAVNCSNNNEIYAFHPGGALTLFGDGSVRFLSQQVEMRLVAAAISRFAGEPFGPP